MLKQEDKLAKNLLIEPIKSLIFGLFIIIVTFPSNEWAYSFGIDPPLSWVYNFLFENGLKLGKDIIFPHGPLAFFMYPLPNNILISTLVYSFLKILLVFNLANLLSCQSSQTKWSLTLITSYFISIIAGFNHLILANLILIYCNSYLLENRKFRYIAYIITAFAFYVKAYIAIISGVMFLSYTGYFLFNDKKLKTFLLDCLTLFTFISLCWILMYNSISGFPKYLLGMFYLAQDNSSAASYYPYNNWVILSLFILMFPLLILLNKTKKFLFYSILIGLSLFAAWKHGMARQDIYHVKGFYIYFIICSFILFLFYKKNFYINILIVGCTFILLTISLKYSVNYQPLKYDLFRANNFVSFITEFHDLKIKSEKKSEEEISINKLPKNIIDSINNSTVDVYPWDYSVISANNLNWQPRVVINSYASYTSWLDKQNANHFNVEKAPKFLILELQKISSGINGTVFNSIDDRYLLNDEPNTIIQLLKNYEYWYSNDKFIIVKQREDTLGVLSKNIYSENLHFGEWLNVPEMTEGQILRSKLTINKSILQNLKSFFYKDEQFWVYLKLDNDEIHKYRIVPKNASDGLWINPYVFTPKKSMLVKSIMFKASNEAILNNQINVAFETFNYSNSNVITSFFGNQPQKTDSILLNSIYDFETNKQEYWDTLKQEFITKDTYKGLNSFLLNPSYFSLTFSYPLDSLPMVDMRITANCWIKSKDYTYSNDIMMVLSIDNDQGNIAWKGIPVDRQLIDQNTWNNVFSFIDFSNNQANCILKAYLWNTSNKEILIDDFRIIITTP
jgi:hypothetical protein